MTSWNKKDKIIMENVLLVEGVDAKYFCIWALEAYQIENVQVIDFGGNEQLTNFLTLFKDFIPGSEKVKKLIIIRDAETNLYSAISNIQSALRNNGYSVPESPFEFVEGDPQIAFGLFPGIDNVDGLQNGTLEDLCLSTISDDVVFHCIEQVIKCLSENGTTFRHPHKTKLHAYLAFKNEYVGMKLGEAAKAKAFDWEHPSMFRFNQLLRSF